MRRAAIGAAAVAVASVSWIAGPAAPAGATPSSGFHFVVPYRVLDTRNVPGSGLAAGVERAIVVAGFGAVPPNATRASVKIVTVDATGYGQLRVHPCGAYNPAARAQVPVRRGIIDQTIALPVLQAGGFCVTSSAATQVVIDITGYEDGTGGMAFVSTVPKVALDDVPVAAGSVATVQITGQAGVASGAGGVSVFLRAGGGQAGFVTAYACDQARPSSADVTYADVTRVAAAIAPLSAVGTLCIYSHTSTRVSVAVYGYYATGATPTADGPAIVEIETSRPPGFVAVTPVRAFDTRSGAAPLGVGDTYQLDLTDRAPASATDVVLNVTVTEPGAAGYVTVYPCSGDRPVVSNLNYVTGQTVPNQVTVSLGDDDHVCFYTSQRAHLLADLSGWYVFGAGDGLVTRAPARLFDTRAGAGLLRAGTTFEWDLSGTVDAQTSAVIMNVTVTEATGPGFVTVYPCSAGRPTASNLNYVARQTVPNLVTVAVRADRRVCFYVSGATQLLADLAGSYSPTSSVGFVGFAPPDRRMDTRTGARPASGATTSFSFGPGIVETPDLIVAVVLNVTAVEPVAAGFVTAYPCASGRPTASNVNYVAGDVVPNQVIVAVDEDDDVCFYTHQSTHLVVDEAGFFTAVPYLTAVVVR